MVTSTTSILSYVWCQQIQGVCAREVQNAEGRLGTSSSVLVRSLSNREAQIRRLALRARLENDSGSLTLAASSLILRAKRGKGFPTSYSLFFTSSLPSTGKRASSMLPLQMTERVWQESAHCYRKCKYSWLLSRLRSS